MRLEDDDRASIELSKINISDFTYDVKKVVDYINYKWQKMEISNLDMTYADRKYVLARLRNAVVHGNIKCFIQENEVYISLNDRYENREEIISISMNNLNKFLSHAKHL